jgi:serine acetyltransferase
MDLVSVTRIQNNRRQIAQGRGSLRFYNLKIGIDYAVGVTAIVLPDVPRGSFMMEFRAKPMLIFRGRERHLRQVTIRQKTVSKPNLMD